MNQIKLKKIGAHIANEVSNICLLESRDELLKNINITGCDVTSDLSFAYIYFTTHLDKDKTELEKELNDSTAGYLRTKLASSIEIRHTPKLIFKYDNSIEYGMNIEHIINEIHEKDSK